MGQPVSTQNKSTGGGPPSFGAAASPVPSGTGSPNATGQGPAVTAPPPAPAATGPPALSPGPTGGSAVPNPATSFQVILPQNYKPSAFVPPPVTRPPLPSPPPNSVVGQMPDIQMENTAGWQYRYNLPLENGRKYLFDGWNIGKFHLIGGSCGAFTIEYGRYNQCNSVSIYDDEDTLIFSEGRHSSDRITIQDNPLDGSSSVIFTQDGTPAQKRPIPVTAMQDDLIYLTGERDFVINGNCEAYLVHAGQGSVTVNGNLKQVGQDDCGQVQVHGSVRGMVYVTKSGGGSVTIDGSVWGRVIQEGRANVNVKGDVIGDIQQYSGRSQIVVEGKHHGTVLGNGTVRVMGN